MHFDNKAALLALANELAFAKLHPLFQIWSLLAPKSQDGDGQNANLRLQVDSQMGGFTTAPSIIYADYVMNKQPEWSYAEYASKR